MEINIQSPTSKDFPPLEKLHNSVTGALEYPNFRKYIRVKSHLVKIACVNSKIVGYIIGYQNDQTKARIYSFYVLPNYRNQQIGSNMLQDLEKNFQKEHSHFQYLSVRIPEEYFDSESFFLKRNFNVISKINIYEKNNLNFPYQINPSMKIKLATRENLRDLIELEEYCFSAYWRFDSDYFSNMIKSKKSSIFVAIENDRIVGYNCNTISDNNREGYYVRVAAHPEFRRRYICTNLTAKAFQWFKKYRNIQKIRLSTFAESQFHNKMYSSWGFLFVEQELIMAKTYF
ncbi:MAG: GNAT family N-acetyltransferase [Candidatus Hodarchaeales archaeon]|jgi:ribosomal protein S18 acetylase RimI-like enzyme